MKILKLLAVLALLLASLLLFYEGTATKQPKEVKPVYKDIAIDMTCTDLCPVEKWKTRNSKLIKKSF